MANCKLVLQHWGVEVHTRRDEKDSYKQSGAAVESDGGSSHMSGLSALQHYIGREVTTAEQIALQSKGFIEV